jgi:hypothetical protein
MIWLTAVWRSVGKLPDGKGFELDEGAQDDCIQDI